MNERIRLLAEQAGIVFWEISGDVDWRQANREHMEKFAELIVRECVGMLEKEAESNHDEGTETYNLLLKESKWMKQHFGVE